MPSKTKVQTLMQSPKFAIGFIVYRPELAFNLRLSVLNNLGIPFYIYDNSPELLEVSTLASQFSFCKYITDGKNLGLGVGLKRLCSVAHKDGIDALLFFDQDTGFGAQTIEFAKCFLAEHYLNIESNFSAVCLSDKTGGHPSSHLPSELSDCDLIINSGSIFILKNLSKLGWHNDTFFVDGVDYEFCLRSHALGMRLGICYGVPGFDHVSEQPDKRVLFFGRTLAIRRYSGFRIRDAAHSYVRLICTALSRGQYRYAAKFIRSFFIYLLSAALARVL